jgi:UDP-glucose 4-epimerase
VVISSFNNWAMDTKCRQKKKNFKLINSSNKMNKNIFIIGSRANLSKNLKKSIPRAQIIPSNDVKDLIKLLKQAGKSSIIYNVSYKSSLLAKRDQPEAYAKYSFEILSQFVSVCLKLEHLIDKVIFTSSSAVYGENLNAKEIDPINITSLYASLKFSSELFIKEHLEDTSIKLQIVRIFNMYGGLDNFSVVSSIGRSISQKRFFTLINNGESLRDFIHISDVVEIYKRLLISESNSIVNIGTGSKTPVRAVIEAAEKVFGIKLLTADLRRKEIAFSCACTDNLLSIVGNIKFIPVIQYFEDEYKKIKDGDLH